MLGYWTNGSFEDFMKTLIEYEVSQLLFTVRNVGLEKLPYKDIYYYD